MTDITLTLDLFLPLLLLVALACFFLGRRTGGHAARVRELGEELSQAREESAELRRELDGYRTRVADHFAETSHRLHDLTLQYRAVYDHLAKGASELCPEGFEKLEGGLGLDALPEESGPLGDGRVPADPEADPDDPRAY